jgi:DNA-binding LacI/PurR family transcriptional regulator
MRRSTKRAYGSPPKPLVKWPETWQSFAMTKISKRDQSAALSADISTSIPTSYHVAQKAGVSQSAVSRCFRPGSSISPKTRARVMAAARELGYFPNAIASGLITKRSNLVAVLISNLTNLYYPEVLAEITRRLSDRSIRVLLFTLQAESDVDAVLDQVWRYRVDGAIVAARLSPPQLRDFTRHRVPIVLYNRFGEGEPVASVCCDSMGGERQLVERLVGAGHKEFGIIAGPDDSYVSQERVRGAEHWLRKFGYEAALVKGAFDYESGEAGLRALMTITNRKLDALICANDLMAIGAIDCARTQFGLAVPQDLSVVGFDGVAPAAWASYRLSTVRQPVRRMTEAAVSMLMERIDDPDLPPEVRTFAGAFVEGASARLGVLDESMDE